MYKDAVEAAKRRAVSPGDSEVLAVTALAGLQMAIGWAKQLVADLDADIAIELELIGEMPGADPEQAEWLESVRKLSGQLAFLSDDCSLATHFLAHALSAGLMAMDRRWDAVSRFRNLHMLGLAAGVLVGLSGDAQRIDELVAGSISANASRAAKSRKSVEKMGQARRLFDEWKAGKHKFHTNTAFAQWACEQCSLSSQQHLARMVGKWEKERLSAGKQS